MQKWLLFGKAEIEYEKAQLLFSGVAKSALFGWCELGRRGNHDEHGGTAAWAPAARDSTGGARLARPVELGIVNPAPPLAPAFEGLM